MSLWIQVPKLFVFFLVIWLLASLLRSCIRTSLQNRRVGESNAKQTRSQDAEVSAALQQTYVDLSITGRAAEWFSVRIFRIDQESTDVKSFYLVEETSSLLPRFLPGQHLLIERPKTNGEAADFRCYTLSNDCSDGYWRISVKKNSEAATSVSRWMHEELAVGDTVRVRGPAGSFYLHSSTHRHVVLLSAGIGITPMLPMLLATLQRSHASLSLFAQFRDVDHMPFGESLLSIAHKFPLARIKLWLSQFPRGVKGSSTNVIQEGKFSASGVCSSIEDLTQADFYLCGPEAWQSNLKKDLIECGAPEKNIRYELFQESMSPAPPAAERQSPPCSVHFRQSNKLTAFASTYPNLLGFAMGSDVPISSGCRSGACGSCAIRLLQGKVRYTRQPQFQLKANEILPCVCVPDGNIVVDA